MISNAAVENSEWVETRTDSSAGVRGPLPEGYYLEHFFDVLSTIRRHYSSFLSANELQFINQFLGLSTGEQQLFVRIANRKGSIFFRSRLFYPEIEDISRVVDSLIAKDFIRLPGEADLEKCFGAATRNDLLNAFSGMIPLKRSGKREQILAECRSLVRYTDFKGTRLYADTIIQCHAELIGFLYFLFFGSLQSDLRMFAMRDLGIRESNSWKDDASSRFESPHEARSEYFFSVLREKIRIHGVSSLSLEERDRSQWLPVSGPGAGRAREQCVWEISQDFIQQGEIELALVYLKGEESPRAIEKRIRLIYSSGDTHAAELLLREIIADPPCSEVLLFAEDFLQRKFGNQRLSRLTQMIRNAESIRLTSDFRGQSEKGVAQYYENNGHRVYRSENFLWNALFGVVFWEELFEGPGSAIHSEFDRTPSDLLRGTFYDRNFEAIERKIGEMRRVEGACERIRTTIARVGGTRNGVFHWHALTEPMLLDFVSVAAAVGADVGAVLRELAKNFRANRKGFPDLLVIEDEAPRFIEVKAPGDALSRAQLRMLQLLNSAGFKGEVVRVDWKEADEQTYVVIDVETTGGSPITDRITEVGAVKIRNRVVVETYSTLVNPKRRIPARITALTGITNDMVLNAPEFSRISPGLLDFMGDAIVVGHNARFDYSFLTSEFRRVAEHFRRPVYCTCTGMRKAFPGRDSYKLGNLCADFGIELAGHHRALHDAKATAELLLILLNQTGTTQERTESI